VAKPRIEIGEARGIEIGEARGIKNMALNLLKQGCEMDLVCKVSGFSKDEIKTIIKENRLQIEKIHI